MARFVCVVVPGRPIAKARPRLGRGGHVYTPDQTSSAEEIIAGLIREQCLVPLEGPVKLSLQFTFGFPKGWSNAKKEAMEGAWYTGRPDLDNLVKLVKDAGNRILWKDDSQVVELEACKVYGWESDTLINVSNIEG